MIMKERKIVSVIRLINTFKYERMTKIFFFFMIFRIHFTLN